MKFSPQGVFWIAFFVSLALLLGFCTNDAKAADEPLWVSTGKSVTNSSYPLLSSRSWGVAQDLQFAQPWERIRLGYVNEGHKESAEHTGPDKRDGIYAQWLGTHWLTPHIATELSFGPYITATTVGEPGAAWRDEYRLAAMLGAGVRARYGHANVMLQWQRALWAKVDGHYGDTDIFGIWLGLSM